MNFRKLTSTFLTVLMVVSLALSGISCSDTETTDSTKFAIYYSGMTDIGPSMNGIISSPTYIGAPPSDFAITNVTVNNETFSGDSFTINSGTGEISISNTKELAVGMYRISISCLSGGTSYDFKDAVEINLMAPVPDGIKVEPNVLKIDYADIHTANDTLVAQVTTDGEHVSISKYEIAGDDRYKDFFAITATGEISINKKFTGEIAPGIYNVSLKLTTAAGTGIFEEAVTFNITSKPLELVYTPNTGKAEEETESGTTFTSGIPTLKGSQEGVAYSISNITPATDKITIDKTTGVLSLGAGHGLKAGEKYVIDVNVTNEHAPEGVDFKEVFTLEIVSFINPIDNFSYVDTEVTQGTEFEIARTEGFIGDEVIFELIHPEAALQGQLSINPFTGTITAQKGNTIPVGNHTVTVKASNVKSEKIADFTLAIKENVNYFSYIRYGNNLNLPVESSAFQYRVRSAAELAALDIPVPTTDIHENATVEWSVKTKYKMAGTTIDKKTGKLKFTEEGWTDANAGMIIVTATTGNGTKESVSVSVPVFFHFANEVSGVTVEYTPFVFQVNPKTGGKSVEPVLNGVTNASKFLMDYRRSFNYYNLNGSSSHIDGALNKDNTDTFMAQVWRNFYGEATPNYGAKKPMSYYDNKTSTTSTLGFVDPDKNLSVVINPNKWIGEDKEYANGVMIGQMTFVTDGKENGLSGSKNQIFPLFIWFDEKF